MRRALATMVCAAVLAAGCAQAQDRSSPTAPLKDGVVTVWVVTPGNESERNRATVRALQKRSAVLAVPPGYKESTAGSFGRSSSEVGQTAGTYGQSAGSFGRNASDTGQSAGSYGQSAGSLGTSAGNAGQPAGTYGQSAGSFGQPASTYGQTLSGQSLGPVARPAGTQGVVRNVERERTAAELSVALPSNLAPRKLTVLSVAQEDLEERLAAVQGTEDYPDVVMLQVIPRGWNESGVGLMMLGTPSRLDGAESSPSPARSPDFTRLWPVVMMRAPHPMEARALVVWIRDRGYCTGCEEPTWRKGEGEAAVVAAAALQQMLSGGGLGASVDVDAAKFNGELARSLALSEGFPAGLDELQARVDVLSAYLSGNVAVVTLRGIVWSTGAFGVVHGRVVLRKDDHGLWKVLQLSPNLADRRLSSETADLTKAVRPSPDRKPAILQPISSAAPVDGDNRSPRPDLWWDNAGDPSLMVVEWQRKFGGEAWTDPRLMLLPDGSWRLQTRITAAFADSGGTYRWRVWSLGHGGVLILSPWKTFNVVQ